MSKKVLITGVAGLLGANFSRYLLKKGYNVVGVEKKMRCGYEITKNQGLFNNLSKSDVNNKNFYVFTGSSVGVVQIMGKGIYVGKIDNLGTVKAFIK